MVKRVEFVQSRETVILISANPAYPPREIQGAELETLRIEGRVIACLHRF